MPASKFSPFADYDVSARTAAVSSARLRRALFCRSVSADRVNNAPSRRVRATLSCFDYSIGFAADESSAHFAMYAEHLSELVLLRNDMARIQCVALFITRRPRYYSNYFAPLLQVSQKTASASSGVSLPPSPLMAADAEKYSSCQVQ